MIKKSRPDSPVSAPRGTRDILPDEIHKWHFVEESARKVFETYGYREIRPPIIEHTEVFSRTIGEATDIVNKEMYTFEDRGGRSLTLRPEMTAGVARSYVEHKIYNRTQLWKVYYTGPMFRYEKPQLARYRQFYQLGVEAFGSDSPALDFEIISIGVRLFTDLGFKNLRVKINSIGNQESKSKYGRALTSFLEGKQSFLCDGCKQRLQMNPLRVLDCKQKDCIDALRDAPGSVDFLDEGSREHFESVLKFLDSVGLSFEQDNHLIRGLDYYTHTLFEIVYEGLGARNAIAGGGRYDNLVETLGGPATPAVGFAPGLDAILIALEKENIHPGEPKAVAVYIASTPDIDTGVKVRLAHDLRSHGVACEMDYKERSLKAQFKEANRLGAQRVVILAPDEISEDKARIRRMEDGEETLVSLDNLVEYLAE